MLKIAAQGADAALQAKMIRAAEHTSDRGRLDHLLQALADVDEPGLRERTLSLVLSGAFDPRDRLQLIFNRDAVGTRRSHDFSSAFRSRQVIYDFIERSFDALAQALPREQLLDLSFAIDLFCDESHRHDASRFFGTRLASVPGGPRAVAQALERMDLCIEQKRALEPQLAAFLERNGVAPTAPPGAPSAP